MHPKPTAVFLHFLGGSARTWSPVIARLGGDCRTLTIDLPGFGDAADQPGASVTEMADAAASRIQAAGLSSWVLVGHSMGAKVACVLARRAEDGAAGLAGLAGLVLVAGSPPSPEPMDEAKRAEMLGWFEADPASNARQAHDFIANNVTDPLPPALHAMAAEDTLRADPVRWRAWLESGSNEDWSDRVGVLQTPALILAGADDTSLGPEAQAQLMAPHFATVRQVDLPDAKHLLPLEHPGAVAALITERLIAVAYTALIHSARVSAKTRQALLERAEPDAADYAPQAMDAAALATLHAVLARVLPQDRVDLGQRIDKALASGESDGWRFAILPADAEAYRENLAALAGFAARDEPAQDALLGAIAVGEQGEAMQRWFEDLRGQATMIYASHPSTFARMGYSGIAYGGDEPDRPGFHALAAGEREPWEPVAR